RVGGDILFIESILSKGKGNLTITGNLGKVMKESATIAMEYIKANANTFDLDPTIFDKYNVHIHVPEGATPKDGPSAGITLATSIVSLLTGTFVSKDIAMTGEITLTGKVLPVGGIKEKALAAMRCGIETIIIPWKNQKDLVEIPEKYRKKLNFVPVKNFQEVLAVALLDWEPQKEEKTQKKNTPRHNQAAA
ncbi:MAG: endopeptidase La, partial [Bacteriovoracaceae bacterium]|nr:endopeptidase La [Bacteriovoracaceae bacterium]